MGQKSGLKASVVDFWTYSVGQKSGQIASVVDLQCGTNIGAISFSSRIF